MSDTAFEQAFFGMIKQWPTVSLAALDKFVVRELKLRADEANAIEEKRSKDEAKKKRKKSLPPINGIES